MGASGRHRGAASPEPPNALAHAGSLQMPSVEPYRRFSGPPRSAVPQTRLWRPQPARHGPINREFQRSPRRLAPKLDDPGRSRGRGPGLLTPAGFNTSYRRPNWLLLVDDGRANSS